MNTFKVKDYTIYSKKIGTGSFSTIHKAYKDNTNKPYAIKKINYDPKNMITENYKTEFNLLRKINHKHIIKLYDIIIDKHNENIYLVLDYYKNGDLGTFLRNKSLKEKFAKKYMLQLKDGLQYLIKNNIMHRDLKPQNILITDEYTLKITDFGLARYFQNDNLISTICGSPMYMSPEILQKKNYNIKSDLWSVGIILYQMLYGKVPFKSKNIVSLIKEINKNSIVYVNNYIISQECIELIQKLLMYLNNDIVILNPINKEEFMTFIGITKIIENYESN